MEGGVLMSLVRAFSKADKEGKVSIPGNIRLAAGIKEGQLLEFKIVGASKEKKIMVSRRENTR